MVANIIAIIMMALGVASGTKATSNTFYDDAKPKSKRAVESVVLAYTDTFTDPVQRIATTNPQFISEKRYLGTQKNSHFYTNYCNIYNTIYDFYGMDNGYNTHVFMILVSIDNYTSSTLNNVLVNTNIACQYTAVVNDTVYMREYDNNELEPYIDQTLTQGTSAMSIYSTVSRLNYNQQEYDNENKTPTQMASTPDYYYIISSQEFSIPSLPAHSSIDIAFFSVQAGTTNNCSITTDHFIFQITGNVEMNQNNYEVIDLPGLMYTVLTMPFSFISTAFNLTVFPGTPYSLNFGNLFLTVLAVFILLWLIKKVFH